MMKINNFLSKIIDRRSNNIYVTLFFLIFLIIGLSIVKDYGITTDEPFQRTNIISSQSIGFTKLFSRKCVQKYQKKYHPGKRVIHPCDTK